MAAKPLLNVTVTIPFTRQELAEIVDRLSANMTTNIDYTVQKRYGIDTPAKLLEFVLEDDKAMTRMEGKLGGAIKEMIQWNFTAEDYFGDVADLIGVHSTLMRAIRQAEKVQADEIREKSFGEYEDDLANAIKVCREYGYTFPEDDGDGRVKRKGR